MRAFERFEGVVHDRVFVGDSLENDVSVIAGDHETDSVSLRWCAGCTDASIRLTADQAIELGSLLLAAGGDTKSRAPKLRGCGTDETEAP